MAKKANGFTGIALSFQEGVLLETDKEGRIDTLYSFPVLFEENRLVDSSSFAVEISRQLERGRGSKVALLIEPLLYAIRGIELPVMPVQELKSVIEGEAAQYPIFEDQPVFVSFAQEKVKESAQGKQMLCLIAATTQPPLLEIMAPIQEKKVLGYVTTPYLALLGFYLKVAPSEGYKSLLVLGQEQSYFFGIQEKKVIFVRSLDYGYEQLREEGEEELVQECVQTLAFFENRESLKISEFVVMGGEKEGKALALNLSQNLAIPATYFDVAPFLQFTTEEVKEEFFSLFPLSFYAYAGLFLLQAGEPYLSLLPFEEEARQEAKSFLKRTLIPVPLIFLLFFLGGFFFKKGAAKLARETETMEEKLRHLQEARKKEAELEQEIKMLEETLAQERVKEVEIETIYPHSGLSSLFRGLQMVVPSSCWLEKISFSSGVLTFEGHATVQVGPAKFVENLSQGGGCAALSLASFQRKDIGNKSVYDFTIHCQLKGGKLS